MRQPQYHLCLELSDKEGERKHRMWEKEGKLRSCRLLQGIERALAVTLKEMQSTEGN